MPIIFFKFVLKQNENQNLLFPFPLWYGDFEFSLEKK